MMLRYCLFDLRNYRAWSRDKQQVEKILTPSGRLENVFSGRQLGLVQENTLVVFCTRVLRETVRLGGKKWEIRKKFSPRASILFSTESRNRLTEKLEQSKGQSCDSSSEILVYGWQDEKRPSRNYRHHPVCRGYKSGNKMHSWLSFPMSTS